MPAALLARTGWGGLTFPNAATTGPAAGGYTLTAQTAATIPATSPYPSWVTGPDGNGFLHVTGCQFTGEVDCLAPNVIFTGCDFSAPFGQYGLSLRGSGGYTVQYCSAHGANPSALGRLTAGIDTDTNGGATTMTGLVIDHCNIYWGRIGLNTDTDTVSVTITNNYFHDVTYYPNDHSENMINGTNSSNVVIANNTILNPLSQTATIGSHTTGFSNVSVTGNLIAGGGYAVYLGDTDSVNVVVTGNYFSTMYFPNCGLFGAAYPTSPPPYGSGGNVWSGNVWYDGPNRGSLIAHP